jgi:hypothetical protein
MQRLHVEGRDTAQGDANLSGWGTTKVDELRVRTRVNEIGDIGLCWEQPHYCSS